eukprot:16430512-Heterocapsa_arctica.AAC.1
MLLAETKTSLPPTAAMTSTLREQTLLVETKMSCRLLWEAAAPQPHSRCKSPSSLRLWIQKLHRRGTRCGRIAALTSPPPPSDFRTSLLPDAQDQGQLQ